MAIRRTDVPKHLKHRNKHIGYRILDLFEDCYELYKDGCFIADTRASAERYLKIAWPNSPHYRIERVNFANMMEEYEERYDEYDMELEAYARFQQVATLNGIPFSSELDENDDLKVIGITELVPMMKVKVGCVDHEWDEW